jgi:ribokinase
VFGLQLKTQLDTVGVDTSGVAISPGSSGVAIIVVSQKGENSIVVTPGANALVTPHDIDANLNTIRSAGVVLTQLETPLATVEYLAAICSREGVPLILDPAPAIELPPTIFKHVTWFTPNETEAEFFMRDINKNADMSDSQAVAKALLGCGVKNVILKLGARGAYLATQSGLAQTIDPFAVDAIDTTAAGDAFNGAFATGLMLGKSPIDSARFAAATAAVSVTRAGAQPSLPLLSEVQELIRNTVEG